ncbi:MAG: helix-turn-helix domain-containing protein [Dehalococcoidia bacterium]
MMNRSLQFGFTTGTPLTEALHRFRSQLKKSQADISRDAWLDESYVSRLFSGERTNPSRDALILLTVFGMGLSVEDTDEILLAADYKPLALARSIR